MFSDSLLGVPIECHLMYPFLSVNKSDISSGLYKKRVRVFSQDNFEKLAR